MSVRQLVDKGFSTNFHPQGTKVLDESGKVIVTARCGLQGGMYITRKDLRKKQGMSALSDREMIH